MPMKFYLIYRRSSIWFNAPDLVIVGIIRAGAVTPRFTISKAKYMSADTPPTGADAKACPSVRVHGTAKVTVRGVRVGPKVQQS